jgi:hypothetical protein
MTKKPTKDFINKKLTGDIKRKMSMKSIKIYDVEEPSEIRSKELLKDQEY